MKPSIEPEVKFGPDGKPELTDFLVWFVMCIDLACDHPACGPKYSWNVRHPGLWLDLYRQGVEPEDAVKTVFERLH